MSSFESSSSYVMLAMVYNGEKVAKVFLLLQLSLTHDQYSPFIPPCRVSNLSSVLSCSNC